MPRFLVCASLLVVLLLVGGGVPGGAATRLGLHVTSEELALWRARRTDPTTTINGFSYQDIYNTRILTEATAFRNATHPGANGHWSGNALPQCWKADMGGSSQQPGRSAGIPLMKAAFHFLLTGDPSYATAVETELLSIVGQAGLVWTNGTKWCPYNGTGSALIDNDAFQVTPWLFRLLAAYDYLVVGGYTGFTAGEHATITQWFLDAAHLWRTVTEGTLEANGISGAFDNPPDTTCDGGACVGTTGITHFGGHVPPILAELLANKTGSPMPFVASVGVLTGDTELLRVAKLWFQYQLRFATFSTGVIIDQNRWADCSPPCARSAWGHLWSLMSNMVGTADVIARTGDTSLYTYQSTGGHGGTGTGQVSFLHVVLHYARLTNKTLLQYGTTSAAQQTPAFLLSWDTEGDTYWDFLTMLSNLYYVQPEVTTATTRSLVSGISGCVDNQYGCFTGLYASYPDLPFMWGNLQGVVNPFGVTGAGLPPSGGVGGR